MDEDSKRWAIWIDIEGFSLLWSSGDRAIHGLNALMGGIYAIGNKAYPNDVERLFAHQFGDGFVIISDFHEDSLDRCASIAVTLMRHIVRSGCMARAAIAEGGFADVGGCRPEEIQRELSKNDRSDLVWLGSGLMTLVPVMGTALINTNKLDSSNPVKGLILTISTKNASRLSSGFRRKYVPKCDALTVVDWVHSESHYIDEITTRSGIGGVAPTMIEMAIWNYIRNMSSPAAWIEGTVTSNDVVGAR